MSRADASICMGGMFMLEGLDWLPVDPVAAVAAGSIIECSTSESVVCSWTSKFAKRFRSSLRTLFMAMARFQGHHAKLQRLLHVLHIGLTHLPTCLVHRHGSG